VDRNERANDLVYPPMEQLSLLYRRLEQVLHEETTSLEKAQVISAWARMIYAFGLVLGTKASLQRWESVAEGLSLSEVHKAMPTEDEICEGIEANIERVRTETGVDIFRNPKDNDGGAE